SQRRRARRRRVEMADMCGVWREYDDRCPIPHRERHFSCGSGAARQRDERVARQYVDVIPGEIVLTADTAVGQMRTNGQLDVTIRVTGLRSSPIGFAARNDAHTDAPAVTRLHERRADRGHDAAASARQQVYFEPCQQTTDRPREVVVTLFT